MLSKGKESDFLVKTMFEAMDMHLGVLRRVSLSLRYTFHRTELTGERWRIAYEQVSNALARHRTFTFAEQARMA
jgi:hypothetical protein